MNRKMLTRLWAGLTSGLKTEDLASLHVCQWQTHKKVLLLYLLWRWICAIVCLAIVVCSSIDIGRDKSGEKFEHHYEKWWIYLTNWTVLCGVVQAWLAALICTKALMDNNRDFGKWKARKVLAEPNGGKKIDESSERNWRKFFSSFLQKLFCKQKSAPSSSSTGSPTPSRPSIVSLCKSRRMENWNFNHWGKFEVDTTSSTNDPHSLKVSFSRHFVRIQMQRLSWSILFCSTFCYWTAVHDPGKFFWHSFRFQSLIFSLCRNSSFRSVEPHGPRAVGDFDARRFGYRRTSRADGPRLVLHSWRRLRILDLLAGLFLGRRHRPPTQPRDLPVVRLAEARQDDCGVRRWDFLRGHRAHPGVLHVQAPLFDPQEAFCQEE